MERVRGSVAAMRTLRLLAAYLLAVIALGAMSASAVSANTLTLYEEGTPVPNGAKLDVEVKGFCGFEQEFGWSTNVWKFPALMTANDATPVVISIEPPGTQECFLASLHPQNHYAEVKEVELSATGTMVVGTFTTDDWSEAGTCERAWHNASGHHLRAKHEAAVKAVTVGEAVRPGCRPSRPHKGKIQLVLRGSNGKVLEARYA